VISHADANIPISVRQHLSQQSIVHALGTTQASPEQVEVCLLSDTKGIVQVFTSSHAVVELDKVRAVTGRDLTPLSINQVRALKLRLEVDTLPAFDDLIPADTLIDSGLYRCEQIFVHSGNAQFRIALKNSAAMKRKDSTAIADVATALPLGQVDYQLGLFDDDPTLIHSALTQFTALRIRQRLAETLEVPPLPDTAQAIIRLRVDPYSNIEKLSRIVERDPSLAAQVVSWASSSYYAAPGSVKSVQDAIVRVLGFDLVMNLALGLSLGKTLTLPTDPDQGANAYWHRAIYVAACVGALVGAIPREFRPGFGLCYLAGLLHNFGYLLMAHAFKPHFEATHLMIALNRHLEHQHIEKHILGITREQMASGLMGSWSMPSEVTLGIRYQGDPHYLGAHCDQAQLIYLAQHLLQEYGLLPPRHHLFDASVYERLHINTDSIEALMTQLQQSQPELDLMASALATGR